MRQQEILHEVDRVIEKGPFKDNWESLSDFQVPEWYKKAKFGIFIHWGVFTVPEFGNEWYPRNMYDRKSQVCQYHLETYGDLKEHGYHSLIPMFTAENFNPEDWMKLIKKSGARYVIPVAEHHDGFQLYGSDLSKWNAVQMGPHRDIMGELKTAAQKEGITFGMSNHRAEHCWFFNYADAQTDVAMEKYRDFFGEQQPCDHDMSHDIYSLPPSREHCENWLARQCEMIDKYHPSIVYFDWWVHNVGFKPYLKKFAAYYYNRAVEWGTQVAINYKYNAFVDGTAVYDIERGGMQELRTDFWQTDTSTAENSWGYTKNNIYKTPEDIIKVLVDVVSKNGALLLNIGPRADGSICREEREILSEIGKWLEVNGEAVFDCNCWKKYGEGPTILEDGAFGERKRKQYTEQDIRFTWKRGVLYAFLMKSPEDGTVKIKSLGLTNPKNGNGTFDVKNVSILGYDRRVSWERDYEGMLLKLDSPIKTAMPVVVKIQLD